MPNNVDDVPIVKLTQANHIALSGCDLSDVVDCSPASRGAYIASALKGGELCFLFVLYHYLVKEFKKHPNKKRAIYIYQDVLRGIKVEFYGISGILCPNAKLSGLKDNIEMCKTLRAASVNRAWYERLTNTRDERPPAWLFDDVTDNVLDNHPRVKAEILPKLNKGAQIADQAEYECMRSQLPGWRQAVAEIGFDTAQVGLDGI
jgi:hypothetical protein